MKIILKSSLTVYFVGFMIGCSTPVEKKDRYFWPPPPDTPKIEHLGSYQTNMDFQRDQKSKLLLAITGEEIATQAFLKPWGIASDGRGKVFVTDAGQSAIIVFDLKRHIIDVIENIKGPYGIEVDKNQHLFVTSGKHRAVMVYNSVGAPLMSFGEGILSGPAGLAINEELGLIYVVDTRDHDIKVFNETGDFLFAIGKRGRMGGEFNFPTDVDVNSRGELVVADSMNARIQILDGEGNYIRSFGARGTAISDFRVLKGVAVDSEDHIYVTDAMGGHYKVFSMNGDLLLIVGGPYAAGEKGMAAGGFNVPMDINIDDNDTIFVVDQQNFAFQVFQYMNEKYLKANPVTK